MIRDNLEEPSDGSEIYEDPELTGRIIKKHLEKINMDAWYYTYHAYLDASA